jgi:branched-chain amino acid transport system permease protein
LSFIAAVLGMAFVMVYSTGLITLGAGAFYGIGAYSSALLTIKVGLPFWSALPLATIITAFIALIFGLIIVRSTTFTFVILTLLGSLSFYYLVGSAEFFGGWAGLLNIPCPEPISLPFFGPINFTNRVPYYYLGLFLLILIVLVFYVLYSSRIGRAWNAIKQSSRLAQALGINIYRYKVLSFVVGMSACGVMGSFYAHYFQVVLPDMFSGFTSIYIQVYAAVGGLQFYLLGPAAGAVFMIFGPELLGVTEEIKPIIFGILLIIVIVFFPGGIIGTLLKAREARALCTRVSKRMRALLPSR